MFRLQGPALMPDSQKVERIVFLFHGYGSNGFDLIELAPYLKMPHTLFIAPHGPKAFPLGDGGYAWFDLPDLSKESMAKGLNEAVPLLKNYMEEVMSHYNVAPKNVIASGFSQGAMMALYTAPLFEEPLAGILAFSGPFIADLFPKAMSKPDVALIHGALDELVTTNHFQSAKEKLLQENFCVKDFLVPHLAHSINGPAVDFAAEFLKEKLPLDL